MSTSDADNLRQALQKHMAVRNVTVNFWSKQAGLTEGTLRNFLAGRSESLTTNTLGLLAKAAGLRIADFFPDQKIHDSQLNSLRSGSTELKKTDFETKFLEDPRYPGANRFGVMSKTYSYSAECKVNKTQISVLHQYGEINRQPNIGDRVLCCEHGGVVSAEKFFCDKKKSTPDNSCEFEVNNANSTHDNASWYLAFNFGNNVISNRWIENDAIRIKTISKINGETIIFKNSENKDKYKFIKIYLEVYLCLVKEKTLKFATDDGKNIDVFGVITSTHNLE